MDAIYIIEPGAYLRKDGDCLKIMRDGAEVQTIPAAGLSQLTLAGRTSLSGPVLDFLIEHKIDTVFITPGGRFRARLLLDDSSHVRLRQCQYVKLADPQVKLQLARTFVAGKLENQLRLLLRRGSDYGCDELRRAAVRLRALQERLPELTDVEQVRGVEGSAANVFFSTFGLLLRNADFRFSGRNRRPPLDPINALLSFVYTMFTNEVLNAIRVTGLDPYLGALHEISSGRPSLACDMVEEWRVFGERLVLGLINRKVVRPDDFVYRQPTNDDGLRPVEMKPAVNRALISAWRRQLDTRLHYPATGLVTSLRWVIHGQCRRLAEYLQGEIPHYTPFALPR
ncbi:MAG: CRISPR-associated endonuclease Cas1 [Desulfobulbaceae bacterium A2]|nr:MAG: CRISPR-associated endonuclease Cas1 [Desulfobulbaceae bacterium A2]